jgi:alpha-L-fucosidase
VVAAKEMGDEIKRRFSAPIASSRSKAPMQIIKFNKPETFNHVVTMEDLRAGQRIAKYKIEAQVDGKWKPIAEGKTIGHKRIDQFPNVTATALRFSITSSVAGPAAVMRSIAIFNVTESK